jgi:HSP20 family protein
MVRPEGDIMSTLQRRDPRRPLNDLFDWAENLPSLFTWPPAPMRAVRIEEFSEEGRYVVRAELPGLDPDNDIKVEVAKGILTIAATRQQAEHHAGHSEFHYGSLTRQVLLPDGADTDAVSARYNAGILEVAVPISTKPSDTRTVRIEHAD